MFGEYQLKIYGSEDYVTVVSDKPLSFLSLFLHLLEQILIPGKGDSEINAGKCRGRFTLSQYQVNKTCLILSNWLELEFEFGYIL